MNRNSIKKLTTMGILIALSMIFILVGRIPFPPAPFLVYEPGDVPVIISGFLFGPLAGIITTLLVSTTQSLVFGGGGWIGCVMHFFATSALVGVASSVYKRNKTFKHAAIGLFWGSIAMTAVMIPMNMIFYPLFTDTDINTVLKMIVPIILFNILKAGINSILSLLVYKSTWKFLTHITRT